MIRSRSPGCGGAGGNEIRRRRRHIGAHHIATPPRPAGLTRPGQQHPSLPIAQNNPITARHTHRVCRPPPIGAVDDTPGIGSAIIDTVPTPPESTKTSLRQRLRARANQRWPQLADLTIRHHGGFAYVDAHLPDGTTLPLFRPRYGGSANNWGFAIHLASRDGYEQAVLPSGYPPAPPKMPSTAPAASTSTTPPPGPNRAAPLESQVDTDARQHRKLLAAQAPERGAACRVPARPPRGAPGLGAHAKNHLTR